MARIGCTTEEMAIIAGVSVDTLDRRFAEIIAKGREYGRQRLRRLQWKSANRGNIAMQIWLGKQLLKQRDRMDSEISGRDGAPIVVRQSAEFTFDIGTAGRAAREIAGPDAPALPVTPPALPDGQQEPPA